MITDSQYLSITDNCTYKFSVTADISVSAQIIGKTYYDSAHIQHPIHSHMRIHHVQEESVKVPEISAK